MMENLDTKFPLAFLIALASYTFVLIIEKVAFDSHSLVDVHVHPDVHSHDHKSNTSNTYVGMNRIYFIYYFLQIKLIHKDLHLLFIFFLLRSL